MFRIFCQTTGFDRGFLHFLNSLIGGYFFDFVRWNRRNLKKRIENKTFFYRKFMKAVTFWKQNQKDKLSALSNSTFSLKKYRDKETKMHFMRFFLNFLRFFIERRPGWFSDYCLWCS